MRSNKNNGEIPNQDDTMAEEQQDKRVAERRKSARRGAVPELSLEEIYDGSLDLGAGHAEMPENRRSIERRRAIKRETDRDLDSMLEAGEAG